MARVALFCGLILLAAAAAEARFAPSEAAAGRSLLQTVDCSRIGNCASCRNQRVSGTTQLQCTSCVATYKTSSDYTSCQCAPGYYRASLSDACQECGNGSWCAGGDEQLVKNVCGTGLTTLLTTAARDDQCVTVAGYGFNGATAATCEVGSYSTGNTRNPCRTCGGGLTTDARAATSFADCKAPAGAYFDKNAAKPCPRGSFSLANNRAASCSACAEGVTTAASGSTLASDCALAKPGYKLTAAGATTAAKCAKNFYQAAILATTTCTACATDMVTLKTGAATRAACVAPAGLEYVDDTTGARQCAVGSYKSGANRRPCVACGAGFTTTAAGKISFADCYIPQGFGTTKVGAAYVAAQCEAGSYGAAQNTFGVKSLPCTPCPAGMTAPAGSNGPEDCVTVAGWGYDSATGTAAKCAVGSWTAGTARDECASCGEGYTTAAEASTAATDCVIAPGYGYVAGSDPEPCAKGYYGVGMSAVACAKCADYSTTTVDSLATSSADCNVCVAGYGTPVVGSGCTACGANTYSPPDAATCTACPTGTQSPVGSDSADACVASFTSLIPSVDTVPIDTADATYVSAPTAADAGACADACTNNCMFYVWMPTGSKCYLASQPATGVNAKIAFKSATGVYTVWGWNSATTSLGAPLATAAASAATTSGACTAACDAVDECVAAVLAGTTCSLKQGVSNPDVKAFAYRAIGARMNVWA